MKCLRQILASLLLLSTFQVHAAGPPLVGVILPLSGPLAISGGEALEQIKQRLSRVANLVVMDDGGNPAVTASKAMQLTQQDKVQVIVGLLTRSSVDATLKANIDIPVLSLAQAPNPELLNQAQSRSFYLFAQPPTQLEAIAKALPTDNKFLIAESPAFASKVSVISSSLGARAVKTGPYTYESFPALAKTAEQENATLAAIVDGQLVSDSIGQLRNSKAKMVLLSPPSSKRTAAAAADVVADWISRNNLTAAGLRAAVDRSPFYDKQQKALSVGWSVATVSTRLIAGASTSDSTCSCSSKDGRVTRNTSCKTPPEKCHAKQEESDCSCDCQ